MKNEYIGSFFYVLLFALTLSSTSSAMVPELSDMDSDGLLDETDPFPHDWQNNADGDWQFCVDEFDICQLPAPALVRYGSNGIYSYLNVSENQVICDSETFGKPISGPKQCDYYLLSDIESYDDTNPSPEDSTNNSKLTDDSSIQDTESQNGVDTPPNAVNQIAATSDSADILPNTANQSANVYIGGSADVSSISSSTTNELAETTGNSVTENINTSTSTTSSDQTSAIASVTTDNTNASTSTASSDQTSAIASVTTDNTNASTSTTSSDQTSPSASVTTDNANASTITIDEPAETTDNSVVDNTNPPTRTPSNEQLSTGTNNTVTSASVDDDSVKTIDNSVVDKINTLAVTATGGSANSNWQFCIGEFHVCHLPVPALVRYGLNGVYNYINVSEFSVMCNNATFGNPTSALKQCDYLLSDTADYDGDGIADAVDIFPSDASESADTDGDGFGDNSDPFPNDITNNAEADWQFCIGEFHVCHLPVPALVRYGLNGVYNYINVSEFSVMCNNATFGNPTSALKQCDYLLSDTADYDGDGIVDAVDIFPSDASESADTDGDGFGDNSDPFPSDFTNARSANWVYCAQERGQCSLPVPTLVRYGSGDTYYYLNASNVVVSCNNSTFDNPINARKQCDYLLSDVVDYDADGVVDSIDVSPMDASISVDDDGDGIDDSVDPFLNDSRNGELYYWQFCSSENETCTVSESAIVRFGASGSYHFQRASDSIECSSTVFGESEVTNKQCEFLLEVDIVELCDAKDNPHIVGTSHHKEHGYALRLVADTYATHKAINDGHWFDANTWEAGNIPNEDARVVIPEGITVNYSGISDIRLFTLRVDGVLNFSTNVSSKMVLDTMFVDTTGVLLIGDSSNPVASDVNVEIVIANNGDIDIAWDPSLLSRGLIIHGTTRMHGHKKTVHLKVQEDPLQGDNELVLSQAPVGWQVGDTIVLAGTYYDGYKWDGHKVSHHDPQDEVLTITSITGNIVKFDEPLRFDHVTPRIDLKTSVANFTRNIIIRSELGVASKRHHRGHVMFMHNDDVDVRFIELSELGRTDKLVSALNAFEYGSAITPTSNVKGRYPLHLHRSGLNDIANPAVFIGNAVYSAPGWAYVHHDSNAVFHNNASYKVGGAAFVAETGNELGGWTNNIAIATKGVDWGTPKIGGNDVFNYDMGKTGSAFYFQGRMVKARNNIAASANTGFAYFHRGRKDDPDTGLDGMISFDAKFFDLPEALGLNPKVTVDDAPIVNFEGNETFASNMGVFVEKSNTDQGHDVRTVFRDFKAWEIMWGAHIAYTAHYLLDNFDVVGKTTKIFSRANIGISIGTNASDVTVINSKVDGFRYGFDIANGFGINTVTNIPLKEVYILDPLITNVEQDYRQIHETQQNALSLSMADIVPSRFGVALDKPLLTYRHTYGTEGSRSVDVSGTKTDSLGSISIPASIDHNYASLHEVVRILASSGYYSAEGKNYFILEDYYSDRISGEIHKYGEVVELHEDVPLGNPYHSFGDAIYKGEINLDSAPPIAQDDAATTTTDTDVIINLLANDSDPDADVIVIDGIVQPMDGRVFDNGDGTVTYRPDFDFTGVDTFKYWVTDNYGNFTPATVTVTVQ